MTERTFTAAERQQIAANDRPRATGDEMTTNATRPTRIYVILDTSVLIHGLPIEQLDWAKRFDSDEVVLVLPIAVVNELDKLKDGAEGRFSRDRARDFFARFQKYEAGVLTPSGAPVRPSVFLRVAPQEPILFDGADPLVQDDRIVSAALGFECEPEAERILFARDTTILLKARAKGLRAERVPEGWQIQPEPDSVEKELRMLKKELADLEHRRPKLSLLLLHEDQQHAQYVDAVVVEVRSPGADEIERQLAEEEARCFARRNQTVGLLTFWRPNDEEVNEHLSRYRRFLEAVTPVERELGRRVRLGLALSNEGAAMASKIEIAVKAAHGIRFGDPDDRPKAPRRPVLRSMLENLARPFPFGDPLGAALAMPRSIRGVLIEPDEVQYTLRDLMHADRRLLDEFDVVLPDGWRESGFSLEVTLRVAELPKPERMTFHVRIRIEHREPFPGPDEEEAA
jgi:PIN domain